MIKNVICRRDLYIKEHTHERSDLHHTIYRLWVSPLFYGVGFFRVQIFTL